MPTWLHANRETYDNAISGDDPDSDREKQQAEQPSDSDFESREAVSSSAVPLTMHYVLHSR